MQFVRRIALLSVCVLAAAVSPARADSIISADLQIQGVGLRVVTISASTGVDIPASIQTEFGGKQNDDAPSVEGLLAVGDLSGPGIDTPIRLQTAPGHKFQIPPLSREGVYFLQNIRLMKGTEFLQPATPSVATITVTNLLQTSVKVRQLTPEELRARGISIDARNYEVFEYTFSFFVDGKTIEIPFPVIVDKRTHEVREVVKENPYQLPPIQNVIPPRWSPPAVAGFELGPGADLPQEEEKEPGEKGSGRPSIPAALVIPNNLAVLHQFFAITLMVTNGAPTGSSVTLDSVTALIRPPAELRTVKSNPPVAFNQAVPIVDPTTGATFLIAQAKGSAEWTMEGLKPGTHTVEVEVHATYKSPGQADFPLKGTARASIVVHDPRFNINFSHPDTVRKGIDYSTYSFITNMSPVTQSIRVSNLLQACSVNPNANVCRLDETPEFHDLTIPPGEMRMVEYKLRPGVTGHVYASAGSVSDDNIKAAVQLFMGVSESGIPLSPVTLVMPHYAQYVSQDLIAPNLQLLGLGYSLATAPLTQALASHPRVIKTDVFQRAVDIARAGQRIYLGEDPRDSMAHMALDLLGNDLELREWDDLRRQEKSGRGAGASVVRELEKGVADGATFETFTSRFASTTAHRGGYALALVHGPAVAGNDRPYALSAKVPGSGQRLDIPNEAESGWVRDIPFADLSRFTAADNSGTGELALIGRWTNSIELSVTPSVTGSFSLELIYPATNDGSLLRAHVDLSGTAGKTLTLTVDRGASQLSVRDELGGIAAIPSIVPVLPEPIRIVGARQDLYLDDQAHKVSVLFSRPVSIAEGADWLTKFHGQILLNKDGVNYTGVRPISAAALQGDGRVVNVTFDHALSQNAAYSMTVDPVIDPLGGDAVTFTQPVTPVIDNDRPGGIIFGHVLKGDNSPIANAEVILQPGSSAPQYDISATNDGSFLFEFVPRDIDNNIDGAYTLRATTTEGKQTKLEGAVRLPGRVHFVNLVFLGRGSAQGYVRYDNGEVVAAARVVVGSTMFDQFRTATTDNTGFYQVDDLPVGPLTFSATDADGNVTFGASEIRTPGQVLIKDLSIYRRPFPGVATVRGIVLRSDTQGPVPGAHVGVYSQGYGLIDGFTDSSGRFEFTKVPSGFVTVLASEWSVSRESVALDFDLASDETRDVRMTLNVAPSVPLAAIEGDVVRENPLFPGDASKYEKVAGALVKIDNGQAVTADANGHFVYQPVPTTFAGHSIRAYDPSTKRSATSTVPALDPTKVNLVPIFISAASGYGEGTIRVRVYNAAGFPASGLRVIVPGFPPTVLEESGAGVYQLSHVPVGTGANVWAISTSGTYGSQFAQGTARVEFDGHVASLNLRLPGQGTVRVRLVADIDVIGDVKISYPVWDEEEQGLGSKEVTANTAVNGVAGYAVFEKVPALYNYSVASQHPVYGYAGQSGKLGFDGDLQSITLQLNKLSTVRGYVYAIDGRTPVPGVSVHIEDGRQNQGTYVTLPDGSFVFFNEPASTGFRVVGEITQDGVYRTGYGSGTTPALGGPVNNVSVILRTQGSIDGKIVYSGYKKYDPQNPANNIVDDTPNDLSDNAPVPLAKYSLREFDFPYRNFGTTNDPLTADAQGRFTINNLFTGPLRVSASDPNNQENRGSWTGTLTQEGERLTAYVGIGGIGFGSVTVSVTDPNNLGAAVYNAEVSIYRGGAVFDFATTDGNGIAHFDQLPVGNYTAAAYSKALGRSGSTTSSFSIAVNTDTPVRISLVFSGKVTGKLSDPEAGGAGVPGAPVTLTAFNYSTRASSDVSGDFLFEGVREGTFRLDAKDTLSNRRATATRSLSQADPEPYVSLELEPTETLFASVYLPNDSGGNSNILVPIVNIDVTQRGNEFMRSAQGNSFQIPELFENSPYNVVVREIGGAGREVRFSGSFPTGSASNPLKLVFPAYGSVEVHVMQASVPAANARVTVSGGGRSATVYTDSNGVAVASGIGLGTVYVQAVTVDGAFSGSASSTLSSQSTPAVVNITLGAYAGVTGYVEAELGGPSVGTRVVASFGRVLEMLTDSNGRYNFSGIPTGSNVSLVYMGPDDVTVGARQSYLVKLDDASKVVTLPNVKLDATPPTLLNFFPADGAQNVSPDTALHFTFSEAIQPGYVNNGYIQLVPADSASPLSCSFSAVNNTDGSYTVTMTPPPAAAGEKFPLKSNTLYRIIVSGEIRDVTGNKMPGTRGGSFITSDYAEPHVVKTTPSVTMPLQPATTFIFTFNEPIDPAPWQSGGAGQFHLYKISAAGPAGTVIAEKAGRVYVDPATGLSLNFAPNDPIEEQSFYRVVFSGVRDMQGNPAPEQTFHFYSFDTNKPVVTLLSPVPANFPLISGVQYSLKVSLTNPDNSAATDVARVDYFRMDGTTQTYLYTTTTAPFSYLFVGPDVPPEGSTLTLRAIATDLSGNISDPATTTWQVQPNKAPQNVAVTLTPLSSYANNRVTAAVAFEDEGTFATVQVDLTATQSDGSTYTKSLVKQATRLTVDIPWPAANLDFDLPATLKEGSTATFNAAVTDVRGQKGTASATLNVLVDTAVPTILTLTPAAETRYAIGTKYQITAVVGDSESGVKEVDFAFDNQLVKVLATNTTLVRPGVQPRTLEFSSGQITVPAKNVDTRIPITVTAIDYHGNPVSTSFDVVYIGVNDPTVPKGAWLCPIDRATFPASQNVPVTLQVKATDDIAVTAVKFLVPGVADPVAATRVGTSDTYQATVTLATPAAGSAYSLTAVISDANSEHDVQLTIPIELVAVELSIDDRIQAVTSSDVATYQGKSILVRGATAKLIPHVPLALKNLIVLNGGRVETLSTTTSVEQKLDLTISDHLYVDCASFVDVSARGYLGGWGVNPDGSNTKNDDARGRTIGNSVINGPTPGASASYAGLGGERNGGKSNAAYGSLDDPFDLGTGGAGNTNCCQAGAAGGGAIRIAAGSQPADLGLFVIAGSVRADGGSGVGTAEAGSGGSINIRAKQFITGPLARVTANGGDDDAVDHVSRGAGGGRVAIIASDRFDAGTLGLQLQARGGRNNTAVESASFLDGGAGTVFTKRPGESFGELFVGSSDERVPTSVHLTRPTPLGALHVDRLELGPRALLRVDDTLQIGSTTNDRSAAIIDPTAVLVLSSDVPSIQVTPVPASGSTLVQGATITPSYTSSSIAGVGFVTLAWSPVTPNRVDSYSAYPATASASSIPLAIPATATTGAATLAVTATDRAGRSSSSSIIPYTIATNEPPRIDKFLVTPLSLYPGKSVTATVSASDDLVISKLTLTSTINNGIPTVQTRTPNAITVTDQTFTVAVPIDIPGNAPMSLELGVEDGFPGHTPTKQTVPVTIQKDANPPSLTVTSPVADTIYLEGTGATIPIRATAIDAEVGIKQAYVQIDGGTQIPLVAGSNGTFSADLPVPAVDGPDNVTKQIVVTVKDYEGNTTSSAQIPVQIKPLFDPNAPVVSWSCPSGGALFPAGYMAKLRMYAIGNNAGNTSNGVQKVEFFINDSTTPIPGTPVSGLANYYETSFAIPADAASGTTFTVRGVATNTAGLSSDVSSSFAVVSGTTITADTTISASNTSYDNQVVIVQSGTTTIAGSHTFNTLIVLDGAKVTHAATDSVNLQKLTLTTTTALFVSCSGSIDVTGRGYPGGATYPGATVPGNYSAGSHMGVGGLNTAPLGTTFGSIYQPQEAGGGGNHCCTPGGGIVTINTPALTNDGAIRANGAGSAFGGCCDGGAGGSIWIKTTTLSGGGTVEAIGGAWDRMGGGGALAIEYMSAAGTMLNNLRAWTGGNAGANGAQYGGAGTIYLKGPTATYGSLTINNNGHPGGGTQGTDLPSLGSGLAQTGSSGDTLVTDRPTNIPAYFGAHWIEIRDASGVFKGMWRIATINAKTVTLSPNDTTDVPNVQAGDRWRGVYRFDAVSVAGTEVMVSVDPIIIGANRVFTVYGTTAPGEYVTFTQPIVGDDVTIIGHVSTPQVKATNLTVEGGAILTSLQTSGTTVQALKLDVSGSITVKPAGAIDVTGRGYAGGTTYPGATVPGNYSAGSHIGIGGLYTAPLGTTFGSIYQPQEAGGGGNHCCTAGGGIVTINTPALTNDGAIRANGAGSAFGGCCDGGAGGSIWIKTTTLSGGGTVEAIGGAWDRMGGGGALAIEYTSAAGTMLNNLRAWTGGNAGANGAQYGGAGTIYLKGPTATYGSLTINNNGHPGGGTQGTDLPSLGSGLAQTGSSGDTLVTDRPTNIPAYFGAHWVEIRDGSGVFKGMWRIATINAKTVTLSPNGTSDVPNVQAGDRWRGVYRFDALTIAGTESMVSNDPIVIGANRMQTVYGTTASGEYVTYAQPIAGDDITIIGHVSTPQVKATNLTVEGGAILTSLQTSGTTAQALKLDVSGSITVKPAGAIDVTGRGYAGGATYPGATVPGNYSAGSHMGVGGLYTAPLGTTFGSIYQPQEAGGGGNHCCTPGGGIVTINTPSLTNDGAIRANGAGSAFGGCCDGGAGGSIWIKTTTLSGGGTVEAIGGAWDRMGGGGALAIEYTSAAGTMLNNLRAWTGGNAGANGAQYGGAGTIYLKGPTATYGSLTINNNGHPPSGTQATDLPSLGNGVAQPGSSGGTVVTGRATNIPAYFLGHWVEVRDAFGALKDKWRIAMINGKTFTLAPNAGETITIQSGDTYRGIYRLDTLTLRSTRLNVEDRLDVTTTPFDLDASSTISGNNQGAPVLNPALISVTSSATGASVIGTANAVTDIDKPIIMTATNTTSGNNYTATANADGSFTIPVQGNAGETITLRAKDSNLYPLESAPITAGTLTTGTPTASQIDRTTWTTDGAFRARTLALDATRLLVASNNGSGSDKLVVLNVSDAARPTLVRTVAMNNGPINDIAMTSSGWAVVASNDLVLLDLNSPASTPIYLGDPGWYESTVSLSGGYAFTGVTNYGDGRVRVYEIGNPATPRHIRDQSIVSGVTWRGFASTGNYLIAFTPDKPAGVGHDIVVIDKSNIYSMVKVGDLDIPNFDAYRGRIVGTTAIVTSLTSPDVYVVDLANPAAPTVLGKATLGGNGGGLGVIGTDAFVTAGTAGLVDLNITNPAVPTIAGAVSVTGTASDVALQSPFAYVANDQGLAIVPITTAPQIEPSRVSMSLGGATLTITGAARAITGSGAITVEAKNLASGAIVAGQAVAADGSFTISIAAQAGDAITIEATDASARKSGAVSLGIVPFGSGVTTFPITPSISEPGFHPRTLATDGTNLVVAGYGDTGSTKLLVFDVTNPASPQYKRTVAINNGAINGVSITNGWAVIAANDLVVLDLGNPSSAPIGLGDPGWYEYDVLVSGGYAFTTVSNYNDGRIRIYDVSSPGSSRYVRDQTFISGSTFAGLAALGKNYILAFTADRPGGVGHDLVVLDRTNINNLVKVADLDIGGASFGAFHGKVVGTTLFLAGTNGGVAVVDLSDPKAPVVNTIVPTAEARGVDYAGSTVAIADGGAGVAFFDATNPAAPVSLGSQAVGGSAWSVAFNRGSLYVANDQGLVVIQNVTTAPLVFPSLITITPSSGTLATVTGLARSISGVTPLTVEVKNTRGGASLSQSVAADGSFSILIPASVGDPITVEASDPSGRKSGAVSVGTVPFGSAISMFPITPSISEANFRARTLATDGTNLIVAGYGDGNSTKVLLFDVTNPTSPVYKRTVSIGNGAIDGVSITNGWAIIAANDLVLLDLNSATSTPIILGDSGWYENDVLISGGYAFTAVSNYNDGRIRIYDASNPATTHYLRDQTFISGTTFVGLAAYGNYILAFTADRPGSVGHDLVILDRTNINSLVKVADIDIGGSSFGAYRGKVVGSTLYLTGTTGGVAIVDLANPNSPVVKKILATGGTAYGTDGSGALVVVADGSQGVTFLDTTDTANPIILGSQAVGGNAWSLVLNRGSIYVANEQGLAVIQNVGAAPTISPSLVTISTDGVGNATITGAARSVSGAGSLQIDVRDSTTGTTVPGQTVAGDGSFAVTFAASPGDSITVEATDSVGRKSGEVLVGTVPFGSAVLSIPITASISEANYHPRTLATDGTFLIMGGYQDGGTTKLLVFDIATNPATPAYKRTVSLNNGPINNVAIHNGYAVIAANDVLVLDLNNPASTPLSLGDPGWYERDVAISGGIAFTAVTNYNDGRIREYDISNPVTAHYLRDQTFVSGVTFVGLTTYGTNYIIATGAGHDVVVIDKRDPNAMAKVADLDIPAFDGFRGKVVGTTLYLGGVGGGLAVVDLSDPKVPVLKTVLQTAGDAFGVDWAGSTVAVADGGAGITFLDATNPLVPQLLGTQPVGGNVWSTTFSNGMLYAVNEQALVVIQNVLSSPILDNSLVTITTDGVSSASVTGAARAITGGAPITVDVKNTTTNATSTTTTVAANGSFSSTIAGVPGNLLTLTTKDNGNRSGVVSLGQIPFGVTTTYLAGQAQAGNDSGFRARRVFTDGTLALVSGGSTLGLSLPASRQLLIYNLSTGAVKNYIAGNGEIQDIAIANGYAFIASDDFASLNLADANATAYIAPDAGYFEYSVAILGNYAYTVVSNYNDGRVRLYNITNPAVPTHYRDQGMVSGTTFLKILKLTSTLLVGISPSNPHDVVVIDATNPASLVKLGDFDIPTFTAFDGVVDGATLYVAGGDAGIAIVDLSSPSAPVLKSVINTPGIARGVALSGTNEIVVADGAGGITFIDTNDRANPVIRGTQPVTGHAVGVAVTGKSVLAASEQYFNTVVRP